MNEIVFNTVVGFNVILESCNPSNYEKGKKNVLECLNFLTGKTDEELNNCSNQFYKDFAEDSIFKTYSIHTVDQELMEVYEDRQKELKHLTFLLGGEPYEELELEKDVMSSFAVKLTTLLHNVTQQPVAIHIVAFDRFGFMEFATQNFVFADNNNTKSLSDSMDYELSFNYYDDDDVTFGVIDEDEFKENCEIIYRTMLKNLSQPEASNYLPKEFTEKGIKKIIVNRDLKITNN